MKHLFIINPTSGGKSHDPNKTAELIEAAMKGSPENYEIYFTKAPMDACEKIRQDAASGEELRVYGCGGDGTFNECVNGAALLPNVAVTQFPCGTGNDFIRMFGDEADSFRDFNNLICGEIRKLDIIKCNDRYSVNICSVGIDARVGLDVHKYSKIPLIGGATGYVVSTVVNVLKGINSSYSITTEDGTVDGEFAMVCACNGRYYGGGFNPVPEAMPDDGLMDVLIVKSVKLTSLPGILGKYAKGRYRELSKYIKHIKTTEIEIKSEKELEVNIDGEALYTDDVIFEIIPGGLNFICPQGLKFWDKNKEKRSSDENI